MARSAHAFVRGSTEKFYEWLATREGRALPEGPAIWICGDCHTGNLGPISNRNGFVKMGIRDLDQTVIGNPAHDLVRLGLSLTTGARSSNLPGIITAAMLEQMIEGYVDALVEDPEADDVEERRPAGVDRTMRIAMSRSWRHLAREREVDVKTRIPHTAAFWPLADDEQAAIAELARAENLRKLVTSLQYRDDDAPVRLVDAAYWRKGCSSLGLLRIAMLVRIKGSAKRSNEICLLDIKEATAARAPRAEDIDMPRDNAERVVTGARHLTPPLGMRMLATRLLGKSVFVRELRPQDLKLELESLSREEAVRVARYLASVVGHAHSRQMDADTRRAWRAELAKGRSKTLDAPSWLWKSIVDLVMSHEAAYLEHCRRYDSAGRAEVAAAVAA
jgi:uncharacterized protein (DUF2252 family)